MSEFEGIRKFLSPEETEFLRDLSTDLAFEPGRQGTGYEKASVPTLPSVHDLRERALRYLGCLPDEAHDCYILRYQEGSFIPPHKDDAPFGRQHWRLNVLLNEAEGGDLIINGKTVERLREGDAYAFRPDAILHEVTPITKGTRLVFSLGVLR